MPKFAAGSPATRIRYGWLHTLFIRSVWWARTSAVPFRFGAVAVGDDPFNGRRQGVVAVRNGRSVGLHTPDGIYFYDYRQITGPD